MGSNRGRRMPWTLLSEPTIRSSYLGVYVEDSVSNNEEYHEDDSTNTSADLGLGAHSNVSILLLR